MLQFGECVHLLSGRESLVCAPFIRDSLCSPDPGVTSGGLLVDMASSGSKSRREDKQRKQLVKDKLLDFPLASSNPCPVSCIYLVKAYLS